MGALLTAVLEVEPGAIARRLCLQMLLDAFLETNSVHRGLCLFAGGRRPGEITGHISLVLLLRQLATPTFCGYEYLRILTGNVLAECSILYSVYYRILVKMADEARVGTVEEQAQQRKAKLKEKKSEQKSVSEPSPRLRE